MRVLFAATLLCLSLSLHAQSDSVFRLAHTSRYKRTTLDIIEYLGIPHRNSYLKDGPLRFAFNKPGWYGERAPANGMFIRGTFLYTPPDTANVIYPKPIVYISRNIYQELHNKKTDTSEGFIKAQSCVIHEITHYYQFINYNYISYRSSGDYHAYFCQPYEIDAYAVEAFYYLSKRQPGQLKDVLARFAGDNERLKRELIRLHSLQIKRPVLSQVLDLVCP
jgi:hypothetical protein